MLSANAVSEVASDSKLGAPSLPHPTKSKEIIPRSDYGSTRTTSTLTSFGLETPSRSVSESRSDFNSGEDFTLHSCFDLADVQPWDATRFEMVGKVQDAARNQGCVVAMRDTTEGGRLVAAKCMPVSWVCASHEDFMFNHPDETEHPWVDIGCTAFLNSVSFPYACPLTGVYRDEDQIRLVSELAEQGDLFSWISDLVPIGPAREAAVLPLAVQLLDGVRRLHDLSIVHCDLSLENVLLSKCGEEGELRIRIIDFGMASSLRHLPAQARGKPSYQAPEMHSGAHEIDGFLTDSFSIGVLLYAMFANDYPWLSTRPGGCKCFEYVRQRGFRAFVQKRKLRGTGETLAQKLSEPVIQLLEGLLAVDPSKRLTLGEAELLCSGRRSVWEEAWLNPLPQQGA